METFEKLFRVVQVAIPLLLSGCATNSVTQFYHANTRPPLRELEPYSGRTEIFSVKDVNQGVQELNARNYYSLGWASFYSGGAVTREHIMEQARKVGADIVLFHSNYAGSSQVNVPMLQFTPGQTATTYATGNVNANVRSNTGHSATGNSSYSGMATTTTSGSYSTSILPVTVHRTDYEVSFWRKVKPPILGLWTEPLPDALREKLKRNTGLWITVIGENTPAFYANLLKGDIILAINGRPTFSQREMIQMLNEYANTKARFTVLRDEKQIEIDVQLNPRY